MTLRSMWVLTGSNSRHHRVAYFGRSNSPVIEEFPFHRNTICLPPDIAFQVHLLSQMNEHRGNDLNMFNEII